MWSSFDKNREKALRHLFDKSDFNVYDKTIINLSVGAPGPDILSKCCDLFDDASHHRMDIELKTNSFLFQYGPTIGSYEARTELSAFLSEAYNDKVLGENLIISCGATHGLHMILSTLIDMAGYIFVDEVTYMIALETFRQFSHMKVIPVPLNEDGVNTVELRKLLEEHKFKSQSKMFWGVYYAMPTYHNPTGICFKDDVCKELVKLAREYDILVSCDDVYNILCYDGCLPKRLFAYDNPEDSDYKGNVISNGTFSKIIAPGIRLGWLECPFRCVSLFNTSGILASGGCVNNYMSGIISSSLQLGLAQKHIEATCEKYKERMLAVCEILRNNLHPSCKFREPSGGYFVWIQLPKDTDGSLFNEFCIQKYKIYAIVGSMFSIQGRFRDHIRLSIAFHSKETLVMAAKKVCEAINVFCDLK